MSVEKLITNNLELWTGAVTQKNASGRGSSSKRELTGIKKLRELILELAVRGKLVSQDAGDEPAQILLDGIAESHRESGHWKQKRSFEDIAEADQTFPAPRGWAWVRIGDLLDFQYGKSLPAKSRDDGGEVDVYGSNGVVGKHSVALTVEPAIVVGRKGSAGALNKALRPSWTTDVAYFVIPPIQVDFGFCYLLLKSLRLDQLGKGIKPGVNRNEAYALTTALPPLAEQRRIVQKVDELMALCDQLEQQTGDQIEAHERLVDTLLDTLTRATNATELAENWARVQQHFDTLFTTEHSIERLKQTILQLAVMGRLVPQNPADEQADRLLEEISNEKQLIGPKRRSKKTPSTAVTDFQLMGQNLPDGWCMAFLADLGITSTGKTPSTKNAKYWGDCVSFIGPGQVTLSGEILKGEKFLSEAGVAESEEALPGDLLMVCIGGSIGKAAKCHDRLAFNQQINKIRPVLMEPDFLLIAMRADGFQEEVLGRAAGSATPIINRSKWESIPIPVPPLAEQRRIVSMVERLSSLCSDLMLGMNSASRIQLALSNVAVERAVS